MEYQSLPQFIAVRGFLFMREKIEFPGFFFTYFKKLVSRVINYYFSAAVNRAEGGIGR